MKGYRTFILAIITAILGVLQAADSLPWGDEANGIAMITIGALAAVLRTVTNTPAGKAAP